MTFSVTADLVVLLELDSVWQGSVQGSVYQLAATVSLSLPENIQVFHANTEIQIWLYSVSTGPSPNALLESTSANTFQQYFTKILP